MRTFIALNPARELRASLHASLEELRRRGLPVRWTAASALHLTLRFIGEIEGSEVQRLEDVLRQVAARSTPLRLEISGFGAFPSLRRADTFWVGVASGPPLMALQRELDLALSRLGYGRETKPFRPHITVARLQGGARSPDVERLAGEFDFSGTADIETMDLMRSHLAPDGARHETLARFRLGEQVDS
jgi:RNA 2',3'-cyclic 3'-phosphodiesterase